RRLRRVAVRSAEAGRGRGCEGRAARRRHEAGAGGRGAGEPGAGRSVGRGRTQSGPSAAGTNMPGADGGGTVRCCAAAVALLLAGCQSAPEARPFVAPEVIRVPVKEYVQLPEALTQPCPVPVLKGRTVGDVVTASNAR